MSCFCGCGERAVHHHHVIYQSAIRRALGLHGRKSVASPIRERLANLTADRRNLVPVSLTCHGNHHAGSHRYPLEALPDSVFEFAVEALGEGPAYNWLARHYQGTDPRLEALL